MTNNDKIWIGQSGQKYGPYSETSIRQWLAEGRLSDDALAWRSGMEGWVSLTTMFPTAATEARRLPSLNPIPDSRAGTRLPHPETTSTSTFSSLILDTASSRKSIQPSVEPAAENMSRPLVRSDKPILPPVSAAGPTVPISPSFTPVSNALSAQSSDQSRGTNTGHADTAARSQPVNTQAQPKQNQKKSVSSNSLNQRVSPRDAVIGLAGC